MLNDLKGREFELRSLTARLNDTKRPEQAIGAEMELVVLWSLAQEGSLDVEISIEGASSRPDAHSNVLFSDESGEIIEITAINDGALSGKAIMRAAATKIKDEANRISKPYQLGEYLHFSFQEESGYKNGRFYRIRKIKETFRITDDVTSKLSAWLSGGRTAPQSKLLLENSDISVIITCEKHKKLGLYNYFSSMPAVTYSLERNPLFSALKRKRKQLSGYKGGRRKVIIIADAGSSLLRNMTNGFGGVREVRGEQIIQHFMNENDDIDAVLAVMAVRRLDYMAFREPPIWRARLFAQDRCRDFLKLDTINQIVARFPAPHFEGGQAETIQEQGLFSPNARGWYLGTTFSTGANPYMKISSRALLDFLAGRIDQEQFRNFTSLSDGENLFEKWLKNGWSLSDVSFEPRGVDEDDDYIVFSGKQDPGADKFR